MRVSYFALKNVKSDTGKTVEEAGDNMEVYESLLWYSLVSGHRFEQKDLALRREDMEDVLDHCFFEFTRAIPKFFARPEEGTDDRKKK